MKNPIYASTTFLAGVGTDATKAVEELARLGLDGIEIGSTHAPRPWAEMAKEIRRSWPGPLVTHNYFPPSEKALIINLASTDEEIRAASLSHALSCLGCAADLGAQIYTVHPGFLAEPLPQSVPDEGLYDFRFDEYRCDHEQAFSHMLASLERLAREAERLGVVIAVETEGSMTETDVLLLEKPEEFVRLFATLGTAVRLNFNLAHSALAGRRHGFKLGAFLTQFADYFAACEISHNDQKRDQHLPISTDSWVLDWLPRLPPGIPFILEFRNTTTDAVRHSMDVVGHG